MWDISSLHPHDLVRETVINHLEVPAVVELAEIRAIGLPFLRPYENVVHPKRVQKAPSLFAIPSAERGHHMLYIRSEHIGRNLQQRIAATFDARDPIRVQVQQAVLVHLFADIPLEDGICGRVVADKLICRQCLGGDGRWLNETHQAALGKRPDRGRDP